MALAHILTNTDTLDSLALQYFNDASKWSNIADYNSLQYPYIVSSIADLLQFKSVGYITLIRSNYSNSTVIKAGWQFKTKPSLYTGNTPKIFEVIEDTIIPAGVQKYYVALRCTVQGNFGNVLPYEIVELGDNIDLDDIQLTVYNEVGFKGGTNVNVKVAGETIYIPIDDSTPVILNTNSIIDIIAGEDMVLNSEGDTDADSSGDIAAITGIENIKYAVASRLSTALKELTRHQDYGTEYDTITGSANTASKIDRMKLATYKALYMEDRITSVKVNTVSINKTTITVALSYRIVNTTTDVIQTVVVN